MIELFPNEKLKPKLHDTMFTYIYQERSQRGYFQTDLARDLGITLSALQQFTHLSHKTKPSPMFVLNFCNLTGLSLGECMTNINSLLTSRENHHG